MKSKTIYFVAGESSADNHGAAVMRALRDLDPTVQFAGRGGPQMKALANEPFENWIADAGVLGLWEVLKKYGYFRRKFHDTLDQIDNIDPSAVVLIDYPGFNLRLAKALRRRNPTRKIIYYISPQVWAWHRGRIRHMARLIDLMLCIFPFEADLYNQSGLRTHFVGHPMIDRLASERTDVSRDPNVIGLFPGSRHREIHKIFPILIRVSNKLRQRHPELRFEVAAASPALRQTIQAMLSEHGGEGLNMHIQVGNAAELMQRAAVGVVASGSATLEAAYFRMPFVLIYKVAWLTYIAAKIVVRVEHIGMPNLLAGKEIVPEFIQHRTNPDKIGEAILSLLDHPAKRDHMIQEFDRITTTLGHDGASQSAAREILAELNRG